VTKSSVNIDFVECYRRVLADIAEYYPTDALEWNRDSNLIAHAISKWGTPFFTMCLPTLGKVLDSALSGGLLSFDGLPYSRGKTPNSVITRLFWGLWSRLFDEQGCRRDSIDTNAVLFLRTLLYMGKNVEMECAPRYLFEKTKEYYDVE